MNSRHSTPVDFPKARPNSPSGSMWLAVGCLVCGGLFTQTLAVQAESVPAGKAARPNIVLIMADDLGFSDLGCYGGEIETPQLDALAAGGLRFTQFYNTARCCPTRAALLTGLYSHQAGIGHMTLDDGLPGYRGFLNDRCVTLGETLRSAGYTTLMTGKWHVGNAPAQWPLGRGFDRFWGTPTGGGVYFQQTLEIRDNVFFVKDRDRIPAPDDLYVTETFTTEALKFIDAAVQQQDKPFFLYLAHIAPHWPLQAKPEEIAKYHGRYAGGWDEIREQRFARQQELSLFPAGTQLSPRDPQAQPWAEMSPEKQQDLAHRMAVYAAQVDCVDRNVGRLVARLKELDQFDNTLILFLSDNGCSAEGGPGGFSRGRAGAEIGTALSYASVGLEWANVSDTPFRKFKMNTHEGGIAAPLIVHWPAGIAARGELRDQPAHVIDLLPTLLELAGESYPLEHHGQPITPLAGRSLVPEFRNAVDRRLAERTLFWEHEGNRAVRQGNWKAVADHRGEWELYDLAQDRTETENRAASEPTQLRRLRQSWNDWAESTGVVSWQKLQQQRKPAITPPRSSSP